MSERYKFHDTEQLYFTTTTVVHWIDLFTRPELKHIILESLKHCQKKQDLIIHAWVLMPSHLHMIISSDGKNLSHIFRDFKKHTARALINEIKRINESRKEWLLRAFERSAAALKRISKYKVWRDGNHPILLDNARIVSQKLDYIHFNPVEAEFVDEAENYWYSSARNYVGKVGLLEVEQLV